MIRKSALAASIAALLTPAIASALGLGNIQVTSALNEPLQARIPLRGADPGQLEELRVALADDQQFERAGLERVFVLTKLKFEVVEAGSGAGFIRISTRDPVSEPFLNFLVDVNWARGRVLREYTVLLDPPVYGAAISSGTGRKVRTVEALPPASTPKPAVAPRPAMAPTPAAQAPMITAPIQGTPRFTGDSYGPVRQGETLWSIADRARPAGTSIQTMMLALLRANPGAFSIDNVNALRTGAVLQIPPASELSGGKAAALEEVARQHALWAEYRQSISSSVSAQPGGAPPAPAAAASGGSDSTASAPSGNSGSGESSAELKLVGAGTTGAATGGGADVETLRNDLTMAQEEADAAKLENQELQSRLTEVESLVGDLQRLVELKEDQLAALQDQLAKASEQAATQPAPMTTTEPKATEPEPKVAEKMVTEQPKQPVVAPKAPEAPPAATTKKRRAPPPPPAESKSFMDDMNDMLPVPLWTLLAGIGAVLLAFGGWRFARGRKEKAQATAAGVPAVADSESMIEQYANTELPGDDTHDDATELPATPKPDVGTIDDDADGDLTDMAATARSTASAPTDEEDPLAEVNVYLAYERFDQAEQLVRDAIAAYPDRHDYKLKLLEVFYAAKNLVAFGVAAGVLRDAVGDDHDMMQQAREWWADLGAGHDLLSEAGGPSTNTGTQAPGAAADDELFDVTASEGEETGVDFDLGFEADDGTSSAASIDFDLGADDSGSEKSDEDSSLDFDLGSLGGAATVAGGAAVAGAAAAAASDLDFDIGAGDDAQDGGAGDLDFNLDTDDEAGQATGVDFDLTADAGLDSPVSPDAVTEQQPLPARPSAADSDTGLDFDLGDLADEAGAATGADAGDSSLDFDLDDTAGTIDGGQAFGAGTLHDEAGEESGLDFDLGDTQNVDDVAASAGGEAAGASDTDSEIDFDLGDTTTGPVVAAGDEDSALDFDLGDTGPGFGATDATSSEEDSVLDFDLGDTQETTGAASDPVGEATGSGADAELDFDLGDTVASIGAASDPVGGATGTGADAELDFDLSDTVESIGAAGDPFGGATGTGADAELDFDLGDTLGGDAGVASVDPDAELDFDLGDTASDVGAASGDAVEDLGLDLTLDAGDDAAGAGDQATDDSLPVLDMADDDSPDFDTVQLDPDTADSIRDSAAGVDSDFGVDTEFRGIFSSNDDADGSAAGSESVVDFDLGSADLGVGDEEGESTGFSEVESTQFMLSDISEDEEGQDEDDNTLVLGRGASGEVDEIQTKLDLAQAYMDMGDTEGARNLLGEVMADGDDPQKEQAGEMLKKLS